MVGGTTLSRRRRCAARPVLLIVFTSIEKSTWARRHRYSVLSRAGSACRCLREGRSKNGRWHARFVTERSPSLLQAQVALAALSELRGESESAEQMLRELPTPYAP